jgi:hypothetical protein
MADKTVEQRVKEIIVNQLGVSEDKIVHGAWFWMILVPILWIRLS